LIDFNSNGGTAYGTFQANDNHDGAAMVAQNPLALSSAYTGSDGFVISLWFRHSAISSISSACPLFSIGEFTTSGLVLAMTNDKLYYGNAATLGALAQVTNSFSSNQWNNITLAYDSAMGGQELTLYINGNAETAVGDGSFDWTAPHSLKIGGSLVDPGIMLKADVNLQIGNFIIDNKNAANYIAYNYAAYRASTGINGKY
jgi:hypothetical protein